MNDERPDAFMMIGLRKLAAQNGDGLVPELYELLTRRARLLEDNPNVAEFPLRNVRPAARVAPFDGAVSLEGRADNVVAFPARAPSVVRRRDSL